MRRPRRPTPLLVPATALLVLLLLPLFIKIDSLARRVFGDHAGLALTQEDVRTAHDLIQLTEPHRPAPVPRLIHQILHDEAGDANDTATFPPEWDEMRQSIFEFNPDYEYKLWTPSSSRKFLQDEYPWFLDTYDQLPHSVQKADTLRYYLMRHFGGIYMDADIGCTINLDPLLYYPAWVVDTGHGALSNSILGAEPNHPFWVMVTENIQSYAHEYAFPYITVNYATGRWFESIMWEKYHAENPNGEAAVPLTRIRMDRHPDVDLDLPIFTIGRPDGLESDDGMLEWAGEHLRLVVLYGFAAIVLLGGFVFAVCRSLYFISYGRSREYTPVGHDDVEGEKAD